MNIFRASCLAICLQWLFVVGIQAQTTFEVTIDFPAELDVNKIWLFHYNGKEGKRIRLDDHQVKISDTLYSRFASIQMNYPRTDGRYPAHYECFYVNDAVAEIKLCFNDSTGYPLDICAIDNAISYRDVGGLEYEEFVKKEKMAYMDFLTATGGGRTSTQDSALLRNELFTSLSKKQVKFVRENDHFYYSFWLFATSLAFNPYLDVDEMIGLFQSSFSDSLKDGFDGERISDILFSRALHSGVVAPSFYTTDIHGNRISLETYRGKYLLLDFWATWCAPCIEELPVIRKLRDDFSKEELEIVSVSLDRDSIAFANAIEKYRMNWTHVLMDPNMNEVYGARGIPQVYLIDPEGIILYSRTAQKDYPGLEKLKKIISDNLE